MSAYDQLHNMLVEAGKRPEPPQWQFQYNEPHRSQLVDEVADLEAELDEGWPGWRKKVPFHKEKTSKVVWIKVRLKRRDLIVRGNADHGVRIVWKGKQPFAVAIRPPPTVQVLLDNQATYDARASAPLIADRLGLPLQTVIEALKAKPPHVRGVRRWVRRWATERATLREVPAEDPAERSDHATTSGAERR